MDEYIKEISNSISFSENKLNKINNFYMTNKEIEVLNKYDINYKLCKNINELIYLIEDYLNDSYEELPDLENVSLNLSEQNYYNNTNK